MFSKFREHLRLESLFGRYVMQFINSLIKKNYSRQFISACYVVDLLFCLLFCISAFLSCVACYTLFIPPPIGFSPWLGVVYFAFCSLIVYMYSWFLFLFYLAIAKPGRIVLIPQVISTIFVPFWLLLFFLVGLGVKF